MRKIKCKLKIKISGNWECLRLREVISGLAGCLCNKENCYLLRNSKMPNKPLSKKERVVRC